MANAPDFLDYLRELMRAGGVAVTTRAMFGGHGVYADGLFFGIVDDDVLYLRVDDDNRAAFAAIGCTPFEFATRGGRQQAMSYLRAPDEALEHPDAMAQWARSSIGAALRAAAAKEPGEAKRRGKNRPRGPESRAPANRRRKSKPR
ncbi:MAG: TfoX/Sxy family protein [Betaproteobacteria bacterium]